MKYQPTINIRALTQAQANTLPRGQWVQDGARKGVFIRATRDGIEVLWRGQDEARICPIGPRPSMVMPIIGAVVDGAIGFALAALLLGLAIVFGYCALLAFSAGAVLPLALCAAAAICMGGCSGLATFMAVDDARVQIIDATR